jgi:peptidoglycan/xylan/chitin deacetylase (PgdA/CDA1 family)
MGIKLFEPNGAGCAGKICSIWPDDAAFALFLSHDIDQIYDREFFRLLGDANHLRRISLNGEFVHIGPCIKRIVRAIIRPKIPGKDVETILSIERAYGFRSTFFLLEDRVFNRRGGRYRYSDPAIQRIVWMIKNSGCEVALHGAYHNYNNLAAYRDQFTAFREAFGFSPKGIRNHYLRHDGKKTWRVQRDVGFEYDASFGYNNRIGIREGRAHPFFPLEKGADMRREFVVLPMTIMDVALFGALGLIGRNALTLSKKVAEQVISVGGLLCLNWHNTYFENDEYKSWRIIYEDLLGWLAQQRPWNATGAEIAEQWIRANAMDEEPRKNSDINT